MSSKDDKKTAQNEVVLREQWLGLAIEKCRPHFQETGYPLPAKIRVSIGFPSTGRRGTVGETWHSEASADNAMEIFIKPDVERPIDILTILVNQLVHAALPAKEDHGEKYRTAAIAIGLKGKRDRAVPTVLLLERLNRLADELGPFPHKSLDINWKHIDRPKKQTTRMLKAECPGFIDGGGRHQRCGYTVRLAKKWFDDLGAPRCPKHGDLNVELPEPDPDGDGDLPDTDQFKADADRPEGPPAPA